ncbi:MAG TPA: hypothetical protein VMS17_28030 [Gemmataceae bacterium]|nr:hypothetical protein [Gemmataceae bacterium]
MIRRRRPQREIPFSFDSFLDVVANVVGIILRLILVAWVGARSYHPTPTTTPATAPLADNEPVDAPEPPAPPDRLADDLEQQRRALAAAQQQLLDQLHQWEQARDLRTETEHKLTNETARLQALQAQRAAAEQAAADHGKKVETAALSLPEIRSRVQNVSAELEKLQKSAPPAKHALRYKTPVSQALQTEELFFECKGGRVTLIDVGAMLEQMNRERESKARQLATQWEVEGATDPVGAFRMHYDLERERGAVDGPGGPPAPGMQFSYSISWMVEPVAEMRGEGADAALAATSDFRKVVDALDPKTTAVTFWVYSDSYSLYRRLRDYLHDRDFVVAGRPLMEGMPIGSSRRGTASRGQ